MRIIPRDEQFYEMFSQLAERLTASATLLHEMFESPSKIGSQVAKIKNLEHEADNLTHEIIDRIDRTFVTPFDREDIHILASHLDDVIDLIDGTARRATIFRIQKTRPAAVVLAEVLVRAAKCVEIGVRDMKIPKRVSEVTRDLKELEEEGDAVYHEAMGDLFAEGGDTLEVVKWKDLYDKIEEVGFVRDMAVERLQSIALKNA